MSPVNFKRIQQQNNKINRVCVMSLVSSIKVRNEQEQTILDTSVETR
jgi:hypothetical protein